MKIDKTFWLDTLERTIYTVVEAFIGSIAATGIITEVNWDIVLMTSLTAGLVTMLKCFAVKLPNGTSKVEVSVPTIVSNVTADSPADIPTEEPHGKAD